MSDRDNWFKLLRIGIKSILEFESIPKPSGYVTTFGILAHFSLSLQNSSAMCSALSNMHVLSFPHRDNQERNPNSSSFIKQIKCSNKEPLGQFTKYDCWLFLKDSDYCVSMVTKSIHIRWLYIQQILRFRQHMWWLNLREFDYFLYIL